MSFVDEIIKDKPNKFETILKSRILTKKLKFKINEYDTLQTQYNKLIQQETVNRKPATGGNESLKGKLKQLSAAGKDWLWGVNSDGGIYTCKKPCDDSNWIKIPGGLTQIEGGDNEVWGVTSKDNIYKMNQDHSNKWIRIPGKLDNISQGGDWVWGVNSSHNVYRCKQPCDGKWILDTAGIQKDTGIIRNKNECGNAAAKIYGKAKVFKSRDVVGPGKWSRVPPGCTVQSGGDWAPHWNIRSGTCKSSSGYTCVENKKNLNPGPSLVQLSCSNDYVYGLDTNKRAWRKNIDGSGEWSKFGNPWDWQFLHINASSSNGKILAVNINRVIVETDKNGKAKWKRSSSAGGAMGINTVSGDSQNEDFYFTNTNDQIYKNSAITNGGYWKDIENENYGFEMVNFKQSNSDWKYLGQSNNINDCKVKAVEDKKNEYASIVYTTGNGAFDKSCYGGIKGGNISPEYVQGVTTSLAPNGTSILGGSEGTKLLKHMKQIHNDIEDLVKEQSKDTIGIKKTSNIIKKEKYDRNIELDQLLEKLQKDRIQINKLLDEPSSVALAEDANYRQLSSYIIMLLWILVVIISIVLAGHLYTVDSESISPMTYIFVGVWTIILFTYYYKQFTQYSGKMWESLSASITDDMP